MRNLATFAVIATLISITVSCGDAPSIHPGEVWLDDQGNAINAHGGGLMYHDGTYYWYGEFKEGETTLPEWLGWECYRTDVKGVSCYSSKDLRIWHFEGLALEGVTDNPEHDLHSSKVLERPKVIYNQATGKFVMWMHVDSMDYMKACAGVAVSDSPTGPFKYLESVRPNGEMSRDQTLFVDTDGTAYQICASENNETLHFNRLTDDYLGFTGHFERRFEGLSREAPAIFMHDGKYYLLSSGCSGWDPNEAQIAVADSLLGEWTIMGNPCTGQDADKTFFAQSTYVQPVVGKDNLFIAMFDRWNKTDLPDSRYVWLPFSFSPDGSVEIHWRDKW